MIAYLNVNEISDIIMEVTTLTFKVKHSLLDFKLQRTYCITEHNTLEQRSANYSIQDKFSSLPVL
jgi:hypothetical protein